MTYTEPPRDYREPLFDPKEVQNIINKEKLKERAEEQKKQILAYGAENLGWIPSPTGDTPYKDEEERRQRALRNLQIINAQSLGQPDLDPIPSQPNVWADQYKGTMFEPDPERDVFGDPPRTTRDDKIFEELYGDDKDPTGTGKVWDSVKKKFVHPTSKLLYNIFPGSLKNERRYMAYLKSQGINIPDWLSAYLDEDEKKMSFEDYQKLAYEYSPELAKMPPSEMSKVDWRPMDFKSYLASQGNFGLISGGDFSNLATLKNPGTVIDPKTGLPVTDAQWEQMKRGSGQMPPGEGGPEFDDPCKGPNPPAWCPTSDDDDDNGDNGDEDIPTGPVDSPYTIDPDPDDFTQGRGGWFYNDGGRAGYAGGGIAGLRQGYFIGKLVKKLTKPFKKITKSKLGRAAIMAALAGYGLKGMGGGGWGLTSGWNLANMGKGITTLKGLGGEDSWKGKLVKNLLLNEKGDFSPWKLGIGAASLYPLIMGDDDEDENKMYEDWKREKEKWDRKFKPIPTGSLPFPYQRHLMGAADGGRIGYAGGGYNDDDEEDHRSAALRAMYGMRRGAQEGGLMDMGGMEKDYRQEGGFVPIGGQERADDVPARLSKNEFVFTADAVRAAGGGDIDRGAEVMENVMENLEQGGQVSEESQGLEGARDMFATAQRLEGVL